MGSFKCAYSKLFLNNLFYSVCFFLFYLFIFFFWGGVGVVCVFIADSGIGTHFYNLAAECKMSLLRSQSDHGSSGYFNLQL